MTEQTPRLACGRPVDDVWQSIDQPPDEHTLDCPSCQAARDRLATLQTATTQLRDADQTLQPSGSTKDTVMAIARAEVARSRRLPLTHRTPGGPGPDLQISETAVAAVIRRAADRIHGVRARHCHIKLVPATEISDSGQPVTIDLQLSIAIAAPQQIPSLHMRIRHSIIDAVWAEIGARTGKVDLVVEDIFDE
jgi:uncharacterized alkaline shock family protein YloU